MWPIVERHFEEAEFLAQCWLDALLEPDFTLEELAEGTEKRLLAHLDALTIAGEPVLERLFWPSLDSAEAEASLSMVAGLGVLAVGTLEDCGRLLELLAESTVDSERWSGMSEALALSQREGLDAWLLAQLGEAREGPMLAGLASAMARRHMQLGPKLDPLLASGDPHVLVAAAKLARSADARQLELLAGLGQHADPRVVAAVVETSLVRGIAGGIEIARYWAFEAANSTLRPNALLWMGLLGHPSDQQRLIALLSSPEHQHDALWALGFGGAVEAIEAALPLLADPTLGPLAGELIAGICGLPTDDESLWVDRAPEPAEELAPLADEALEQSLELEPEERLPIPNPAAIANWWQAESPNFDPAQRWLGGRILDDDSLAQALVLQPMRRRHALALLAEIRSRGTERVATRDWAWSQLRELRARATHNVES